MYRPEDDQQAVFRLLSDPASHGGEPVRRVDTHAASVFLAGKRALKVKRAVRFPFLDYSTLERRKAACAAELEVNRAFAPEIYRRVVAITREADGELAIDGAASRSNGRWRCAGSTKARRSIGWRIKDASMPSLQTGSAAWWRRRMRQQPAVEAEPWLEALASFLDQNESAFREQPELFPADEAEMLTRRSRTALAQLRPLLLDRGRSGLIRRGHGDLHLGNIAMIDGQPMLFDAIEFDPLIAAGDVLYDLAFLVMDLIERDLKPVANLVLNRYLAETKRAEDLDALAALPLFLALRAAIRAKVTAARLAHADEAQRAAIGRTAWTYFALACRLIAPPSPALVARRRPLRHRQVAAGAGDRSRYRARPGRRDPALRRRAQGAVRHSRDRAAAARSLRAGSHGASLSGARRGGAPCRRGGTFGGGRCGVRAA